MQQVLANPRYTTDLARYESNLTDHSSQLAVSLAKRHGGEIINGDAMQLYSGLPIITNKVTVEEQHGVSHHLLGCIGIEEPTWVVGTFVRRALGVIEEIRSRGKLPILVGGTHYYTQSLLFKDRLAETEDRREDDGEVKEAQKADGFVQDLGEKYPILNEPTQVLLEKLRNVDPVMADRWHPNDRRKIQRSLEIYLQTGRRASEIYAEQREARDTAQARESTTLRFPTLVFWLHAETETLRARLDARVDRMIARGLLDEVQTLAAHAEEQARAGTEVDESRGIWVSIGFKEFKGYAAALRSGTQDAKELERLRLDAIEKTKIATRQYAKRQTRWIRIKLLNALASASSPTPPLYLLDATDVSAFSSNALEPADDLASAFLAGESMIEPQSLSSAAAENLELRPVEEAKVWVKQNCDICCTTCVTEKQWEAHVRSRSHRRLVAKRKKEEESDGAEAGAGVRIEDERSASVKEEDRNHGCRASSR